jgi:hypothetical protein
MQNSPNMFSLMHFQACPFTPYKVLSIFYEVQLVEK